MMKIAKNELMQRILFTFFTNEFKREGKKFHWSRLLKARKKINLELLKGKNTITYRIHLYVLWTLT